MIANIQENRMKHTNQNQTEMNYDQEEEDVFGETKAERFSRVANPRFQAAMKRLKMLRQMFEGTTANNYQFTDEQRKLLVQTLSNEVAMIDTLMQRRLGTEETLVRL